MLTWSLVDSATSPVREQCHGTWGELVVLLSTHREVASKNGPGWLPADIAPGPRNRARAGAWSVLAMDIEAPTEKGPDGVKRVVGPLPPNIANLVSTLEEHGWSACIATSFSHEAPGLGPRYRVVIPLSRPLQPDEIKPFGVAVAQLLGLDKCLDIGCLEPSRLFYLPSYPPERKHLAQTAQTHGNPVDVGRILAIHTTHHHPQTSQLAGQMPVEDIVDELLKLVPSHAITDLRSALTVIPADDRKMWIDIGHALKGLGEEGFCLWLDWSKTSSKFDLDDAYARWQSFNPTQTGYKSVFSKARQYGWRQDLRHSEPLHPFTDAIYDPNLSDSIAGVRSRRFEFASAGDLMSTPQVLTFLLDDHIEHPSLILLFAPPSAGKSFLAIDWGCCVATGHPWQGHETKQGAVFYIAGEGQAGIARRMRAWEIGTGQSLLDAPIFVSETPAALMNWDSVVEVSKAIKELCEVHGAPALIVIDTFARNMGVGDENSNADVGLFIHHIDQMRHRLGCTVLLVHHSGHAEKDRARGGSALPAAMDSIFRISANAGRELIHVKAKESELCAPRKLKLESVPLPGWLDSKGREMTSAILVKCDHSSTGTTSLPRITPSMQNGLDAFYRAADQEVQADGTMEVHLDDWRTEFYRTATGETMDAKKKAFQRAREGLVKENILTVEHDVYRLNFFSSGICMPDSPSKEQLQLTGQARASGGQALTVA